MNYHGFLYITLNKIRGHIVTMCSKFMYKFIPQIEVLLVYQVYIIDYSRVFIC